MPRISEYSHKMPVRGQELAVFPQIRISIRLAFSSVSFHIPYLPKTRLKILLPVHTFLNRITYKLKPPSYSSLLKRWGMYAKLAKPNHFDFCKRHFTALFLPQSYIFSVRSLHLPLSLWSLLNPALVLFLFPCLKFCPHFQSPSCIITPALDPIPVFPFLSSFQSMCSSLFLLLTLFFAMSVLISAIQPSSFLLLCSPQSSYPLPLPSSFPSLRHSALQYSITRSSFASFSLSYLLFNRSYMYLIKHLCMWQLGIWPYYSITLAAILLYIRFSAIYFNPLCRLFCEFF